MMTAPLDMRGHTLLLWLSREDFSPRSSCDGPTLGRLIGCGLARVKLVGIERHDDLIELTTEGWQYIARLQERLP